MKSLNTYKFEVYLKNPVTKVKGWKIEVLEVLAYSYKEAKSIIENMKDFDKIILDYYVK